MLDALHNAAVALPHQVAATALVSSPAPSGCRHGHSWHVAATKPRAERIAHAALHHRGYKPYLPLTLGKPLFPGYVFLQLGIGQPWYPIAWAPGVYNLLRTDGKPAHVNATLVEALQAGEELRATLTPKSSSWAPGMPCSLPIGPGLPAVILRVDRNNAHIATMMFGQLRQLEVTLNLLSHRQD